MAQNLNLMDPSALSNVLQMLNQGDTKTIKKGEKIMKSFVSSENSVMPLIEQIRGNTDESCRMQAALMLKKKSKYHKIVLSYVFVYYYITSSIINHSLLFHLINLLSISIVFIIIRSQKTL